MRIRNNRRKKRSKYKCQQISSMKFKITKDKRYTSRIIPKSRNMKMKIKVIQPRNLISIINVYAPHSARVRNNKEELDQMYTELTTLYNDLRTKSKLVYLAGDFNSKVGINNDNTPCLGKYSKGKRNSNGEHFIDFCNINGLFISNSAFCHPSRHITT